MTAQGETRSGVDGVRAAERPAPTFGEPAPGPLPAAASPTLHRDLMLAYAKNQGGFALLVPLLATVIAAMTTVWLPALHVTLWLAGILVGNGLLTGLCRRYQATDPGTSGTLRWHGRFLAAELLNGVLWATMAFLGTPHGDRSPTIFVFAVLIVILATRTLTASNLPVAMLAGTLPITGAIVLRFSWLGDTMHLAMVGLAIGAQILFLVIARQLHVSVVEMLALRAEKDALIGELEQATARSEEARRRAEEANLAKSRFLATMSHELRTPLNAILGFSEVLKDELLGRHAVSTYKEYSADIHRSGRHLLDLIDEILDLSRIEAGRYELREEPVSLVGAVEDCIRQLALRADRRATAVKADFEEGLPKIRADRRALRQIVLNLLANAIKFSPGGGTVVLTVGWTSGGGQYLSVTDDGPGIPEDELAMVLQPFGRGTLAAKNAEDGSGLGLSIVSNLTSLHGGRFELRSRVGEGTEAIVKFPRERVMTPMAPVPSDPAPVALRTRRRRSAA